MKEYRYKVNGNVYKVTIGDIEDSIAHVGVGGTPYNVGMEEVSRVVVKSVARPVTTAPVAPTVLIVKPAAVPGGKSGVESLLSGAILDIKVSVGDTMKRGQAVAILEATRMENNTNTDKDGEIITTNISKGEFVLEGIDLVIIE